ncbi:MAG: protein translocase subunit SecF [Gemmatimonadota bacterium]|nr:protein translocase subunit SecF [Gemmatimonadota bacterium]
MRIFRNAHFDFLSWRRKAYLVTAAALIVGLFFLFVHRGLRYGVEFTGGTLFQVTFSSETQVGDVRDAVRAAGIEGAEIVRFGESTEFLIRIGSFGESGEARVSEAVSGALDVAYGEGTWEFARSEGVSPKVGSELKQKALIAILLSFALTLVYLAFRFEWRFGVAAVTATAHDLLLTLGFLSVADLEISLATVAAILTIVGYSLNDTIVVFDRIRENLAKRRKDEFYDVVNASINETLPRTVLTSVTTLVTLLSLFLLGGAVIRPFALILIVGVVFGTYSSIFVASPVLLEIDRWAHKRERRSTTAAARAG